MTDASDNGLSKAALKAYGVALKAYGVALKAYDVALSLAQQHHLC